MQSSCMGSLMELAEQDPNILYLTADSGEGGLDLMFRRYFPDRAFEFGIAEENLVGAAAGLAAVFLVVGGLAALDFDRAFVIFHALFFPGKTNWLFDWRTDPVILILPETFFRNCALLILALVMLWCAVLIFADLWAGKRRKQRGLDR